MTPTENKSRTGIQQSEKQPSTEKMAQRTRESEQRLQEQLLVKELSGPGCMKILDLTDGGCELEGYCEDRELKVKMQRGNVIHIKQSARMIVGIKRENSIPW
ncbi:hypothetical protein TWF281_009621 [Arthrobotrys megalospora]